MRATVEQFREYSRPKRENDYGLDNALARHVRTRWPEKAIQYVAREWDLTEREASSVVYAGASKRVLTKILHHKRGGFGLFLDLLCEATGTSLEAYVEQQAREAAREREQWEARERSLEALSARVSERRSFRRASNQ